MGGCQNYGPFVSTLNIRGHIMIGTQKGTIILTTTHIHRRNSSRYLHRKVRTTQGALSEATRSGLDVSAVLQLFGTFLRLFRMLCGDLGVVGSGLGRSGWGLRATILGIIVGYVSVYIKVFWCLYTNNGKD